MTPIEQVNIVLRYLTRRTALLQMDQYMQHGQVTCYWHSIAVAYISLRVLRFLKIRHDRRSLIIGALLHDYFLYDWHTPDKWHRWHGFRHPGFALRNARRDINLSNRAADIISKHMFPLTIKPPIYRESMVVCLVDKGCSIYEFFKKDPYKYLREHISIED